LWERKSQAFFLLFLTLGSNIRQNDVVCYGFPVTFSLVSLEDGDANREPKSLSRPRLKIFPRKRAFLFSSSLSFASQLFLI